VDVVVIPVGGGGLIAGTALALRAKKPSVRVIGVEPSVLPSMQKALEAGAPVELPPGRSIADGISVRRVGERCVPIVQEHVERVVTVEDQEIARGILHLLENEKTVAEGAGAAGVAALLAGRVPDVAGKKVVIVVGGGNIDVNMLERIIERGLVESGRLTRLELVVPDRPGALADMLAEVAKRRANVVEVHHERAFSRGGLGQVAVQLVLETRGPDHQRELVEGLEAKGYATVRARRSGDAPR
jgi:threonine dehydratase